MNLNLKYKTNKMHLSLIIFSLLIKSNFSYINHKSSSFLRPEEIIKKELKEFEAERKEFLISFNEDEENHNQYLKRKKRTVIFNNLTPIDLGVLFGIPISVALPSLSNFFNFKKWKRSIDLEEDDEYEENSIFKPHMEKISAYFDLLQIREKNCQLRAACEFSAVNDHFYPVSDLILNHINDPSTVPLMSCIEDEEERNLKNETSTNSKSFFYLMKKAADQGLLNGQLGCERKFREKCPYRTEQMLNMPALKFWSFLSSAMKLSFKDNIRIN